MLAGEAHINRELFAELFHFPDMQFLRRRYPAAAIVNVAGIAGFSSACWTSYFNVRATVATYTFDAPARRNTRVHSETVVPVVKTSSTNRISRFAIASGRATANAPRMFSRRW